MAPNDDSNVVNFRDGSNMPADRSGKTGPIERKPLSQIRAEEKAAKAEKRQREEYEAKLAQPLTRAEFQRAMFNIFGSMEKVASEFRKLVVRNEALQSLLYKNGTITREDYETAAQAQWEWNSQIDAIINMYDAQPLNEVVRVVADWNNTHETKIEWIHIDIAPRLLAAEDLTLEEKLQIASDLNMPEAFINELRRREQGTFDANAIEELAANFEPAEGVVSPQEAVSRANAETRVRANAPENTSTPEVIQ